MQYFEAQQRNGGALIVADPRRTSTAPGRSCICVSGRVPTRRLPMASCTSLIRDVSWTSDYIRDRTEGFRGRRRARGVLLARARRAHHRHPAGELVEAAQLLGERTDGDDPDRARSRAAGARREQRARVHQPGAGARRRRQAVQRVRHDDRAGKRTGRPRARAEGRSACRVSAAFDDPAARRHIAAVWDVPESDSRRRQIRVRAARLGWGTRRNTRLFVMGSNPVVSAPDALPCHRGAFNSSTSSSSPISSVSETAELADVVLPSAQWAEEDGTMTNLEGRVIPASGHASAAGGSAPTSRSCPRWPPRSGSAHGSPMQSARDVFDELRRATRGGRADYSGITYERIEAEDGVFWPCPPSTIRARRGCSPNRSRRRRAGALSRDAARTSDRRARRQFPLLLTTGRMLAQYQSGTQTRRFPELHAISAPEPFAEIHPQLAPRASVSPTASALWF